MLVYLITQNYPENFSNKYYVKAVVFVHQYKRNQENTTNCIQS